MGLLLGYMVLMSWRSGLERVEEFVPERYVSNCERFVERLEMEIRV